MGVWNKLIMTQKRLSTINICDFVKI